MNNGFSEQQRFELFHQFQVESIRLFCSLLLKYLFSKIIGNLRYADFNLISVTIQRIFSKEREREREMSHFLYDL